ncbi:MAG: hypothetical protein N2Z58_04585 [Fervidobacterium sp.]|nr:hypothetical protein [Fervidobacterium sp.]
MKVKNHHLMSIFLVALSLYSSVLLANQEIYNDFYQKFLNARAYQNAEEISALIKNLENILTKINNPHIYDFKVLLAECYLEYGNLFKTEKERKFYFEKALSLSQEVINMQQNSGKAYYIAAISTSRLIEYANIFQKLSLLNNFDDYMSKAIKYLNEDVYKGFAYMGFAIRYMNPPWPFNDYNKSDVYFKEAQKYIGDYSGLYLNWGYLYLKTNNKQKALEMFKKVVAMEAHKLFPKAHAENVIIAKEEIKKIER